MYIYIHISEMLILCFQQRTVVGKVGEHYAETNLSSSQQSFSQLWERKLVFSNGKVERLEEREYTSRFNIIFPHYLHSMVDTVRDGFGFIQKVSSVACFLKKKKKKPVCKCVYFVGLVCGGCLMSFKSLY